MAIDLRQIQPELTSALVRNIRPSDRRSYVHGTIAYDWRKGGDFTRCKPWYYENMIEAFLRRDRGKPRQPVDNVLVLVGGIGTGKTTTAKRCLDRVMKKPRLCSACPAEDKICRTQPRLLELDFEFWEEGTESKSRIKEERRFWNFVAARLAQNEDDELQAEEEVTKFWNWCLGRVKLLERSINIHNFLNSVKPMVKAVIQNKPLAGLAPKTILQTLLARREDFLNSIDPQDLVWYSAFSLSYLRASRDHKCRCSIIFFDNVDHAKPYLQQLAVDKVVLLSEIIPARTLIAIRPLTWERSIHGHYFVRTEPHYSPAAASVVGKRVGRFLRKSRPAEGYRNALKVYTKMMLSGKGNPLMYRMFFATSGVSVRWALRNFTNMLQSPFLDGLPEAGDPFQGMRISALARAYFFGQRQSFIPQSFENLYSVGRNTRPDYRLIKPRILDLACRVGGGQYVIAHIFQALSKFGCPEEVVQQALNDLMRRTRPLMWSAEGFKCEDPQSKALLAVTPIGWGYYRALFGEVFYDEVCIQAGTTETVDARSVYDFHQELTAQDLREIQFCSKDFGSIAYYSYFDKEVTSISVVHCRNLLKGLGKRIKQDGFYDPKREEWIRDRVWRIVGKPGLGLQIERAPQLTEPVDRLLEPSDPSALFVESRDEEGSVDNG